MKNKGKLVSFILSLLFSIVAYYTYYLLNHIPSYFYTQLSQRNVPLLLYSLLLIGAFAIIYTFFFQKSKDKNQNTNLKPTHQKSDFVNKEMQFILSSNDSREAKAKQLLSVLCKNVKAKQGIVYKIYFHNTESSVLPIANYNHPITTKSNIDYKSIKKEEAIRILNTTIKNTVNDTLIIIPLKNEQTITGILELDIPASLDVTSTYILNDISNELGKLVL